MRIAIIGFGAAAIGFIEKIKDSDNEIHVFEKSKDIYSSSISGIRADGKLFVSKEMGGDIDVDIALQEKLVEYYISKTEDRKFETGSSFTNREFYKQFYAKGFQPILSEFFHLGTDQLKQILYTIYEDFRRFSCTNPHITLSNYSNLEFDLKIGRRGQRNSHISELMKFVTQAEDAVVVNNNAAAVMLILKTFAEGKEVIISRGELIEIGGSFRIPEIMKASGCKMIEVGATNRTKLSDYENAITKDTALIFKAHKSNYYIDGFTEEVELSELSDLAREHELLFVYDLGSGLLRKPEGLPLEDEPDVRSSIKAGCDIVSFSGDKLLGGPQAGIIAGKSDLIQKIAKDPMMRALRVGKMTIAALSAVMRFYMKDEDLLTKVPIFLSNSNNI